MGLFNAIKQIVDTANTRPSDRDLADEDIKRHTRFHKWIVLVGCCFAAVGVAFGMIIVSVVVPHGISVTDIKGLILAPMIFGAGGFVFGMALMCLFAPRAFLMGPIGKPWMKMIGTKSVLVARIACFLFGLVVTIPLVGIGIFIALSR